MLFFAKWFGVTATDTERTNVSEESVIEEIKKNILLMQSKTAKEQNRPLRPGTHAKGICVRAEFEIFDLNKIKTAIPASRLAKGIFVRPAVYPAIVRFANADSNVNPDSKPDVRAMSFSVDLTNGGKENSGFNIDRQDFSLQ